MVSGKDIIYRIKVIEHLINFITYTSNNLPVHFVRGYTVKLSLYNQYALLIIVANTSKNKDTVKTSDLHVKNGWSFKQLYWDFMSYRNRITANTRKYLFISLWFSANSKVEIENKFFLYRTLFVPCDNISVNCLSKCSN